MKLSNNFNLSEFTKSETAKKHGIMNIPSDNEIDNIQSLVDNIL